jgi:LacI family transcriptional regulator
LAALYSPLDKDFDDFLKKLGVPLVLFDRYKPDWADGVTADHQHGTFLATDHLLGLGHRRIALLTGFPELYPAMARIEGYEAAFRGRSLAIPSGMVRAESFLSPQAFRTVSAMLASREPPTAIIAGGLNMMPGVLRAIKVRGLEIPRDISVIGTGDSDLSELYSPAITTIRWDQAEMGRTAAGLLLDRLLGQSSPEARHVLLPTEFVIRGTTGQVSAVTA